MTSWKSTLGGSLSLFGKSLVGCGVLPQLAGVPSKELTYLALAGFIIDGLGSFFGHLFSADQGEVVKAINQNNIEQGLAPTASTKSTTPTPPSSQ